MRDSILKLFFLSTDLISIKNIYFFRLCDEVNNKQNNKNIPEGIRVIPRMPLKKSLVSHPLLQGTSRVNFLIPRHHDFLILCCCCCCYNETVITDKFTSLKEQLNEFDRFVVGIPKIGEEKVGSGGFRNAFDIPRRNLLNHVLKMRKNFLHTSLSRIKLMDEGSFFFKLFKFGIYNRED